MKFHLGEKDFDFETGSGTQDTIRALINNLFLLFLAWIVLSLLRPNTAAEWIEWYREKATELKNKWGERIGRWGGIALDTITDWGGWLLDGGLKIIRWSLSFAVVLVVLYAVSMWRWPQLTPVFALFIGLAVLIILTVVQLIPERLWPGSKAQAKSVFGIMGMWPIAIAFAFVCFPVTWTGTFVMMLCLIGVYYLVKGGSIRTARIAANIVLWVAIWFQIVSTGIPALQTGIAGGWAKEMATDVAFWDTTRGKVADAEQDRMRVFRDRLYGVATDTITVAVLPSYDKGSVTVNSVPISIYPNEKLEILTDEKAAAWGAVFHDPLLSALGDTSKHIRSMASRAMGYIDVKLVAYMDPNRRVDYQKENGSVAFYVPWGNVRADAILTTEAATLSTQQGDVPTKFSISGSVNGTVVSGSSPVTEVAGIMDSDGWLSVTVDTRYPIVSIPMSFVPGDELELEYVSGTVGHNRLPGGGFDPKYADHKGVYHYTHDVGPGGYAPDPAMASWKQAKIQLLNQGAPYMSLLWGTIPATSGLQVAFRPGADYSSSTVDAPSNKLYLAFNDAWCDKDESNPGEYLQRQCERRVGSINIRVRVVKPEPASEQVGLAVND